MGMSMVLKSFAFAFCFALSVGAIAVPEAVRAEAAEDEDWVRIMVDGKLAEGVVSELVCPDETRVASVSGLEKRRCKTVYRHHLFGTVVAINGRWMAGCVLDGVPATRDIASPRNVACNLRVQSKATPAQVQEALLRLESSGSKR